MWHLTALTLDRIGANAARFLDERLELTDEFGRPLDSIVWLRNGGGKSTVLSLLCAHLRPKRTDFLATSSTGKHLQDYVHSGDTSHTILEWVNERGQRLLTGAVYEWDGLTAPEDPTKNHDRLTQAWYSLVPAPGMTAAQLPRAGADGKPLRLKDYKAALRALPANLELVICDDQSRWGKTLDSRGLDQDLLTPILAMNATEGGIDGAFSYTSPDGFIRYLLTLVADPSSADSVAGTLERVRQQLANRPRTVVDLTFASEAETHLRTLASANEQHLTAATELESARTDAAALAGSFQARIRATETLTATHSRELAEAKAAQSAARNARDIATSTASELRRIAAVLRQDAAREGHAVTEADRTAARTHVAALRGVDPLARHRGQERQVAQLERQLTQQLAGAAPLADSKDAAASVLFRALSTELDQIQNRSLSREVERSQQQIRWDAARADRAAAQREMSVLATTETQLRASIGSFDSTRLQAVRDGLLGVDEVPDDGLRRHAATDHRQAARVVEIDARRTELTSQRKDAQASLIDARTTALQAEVAHRDAQREHTDMVTAITTLGSNPEVHDLAQDSDVDVVAEAADLAGRALDLVERIDRDRMRHAVDAAAARRALDELERSQLLPPDVDLERALGALAEAGIASTSGWRYLADNVPVARHHEVMTKVPSLVAGIAVHDPSSLQAARDVLDSAQLRPITAIGVGTTADLHAAQDSRAGDAPAWIMRVAPSLTDRTAAEQETELLALEVREADALDSKLAVKRTRLAAVESALTTLAHTFPLPVVRTVTERLAMATQTATARQESLRAFEARLLDLTEQDSALASERTMLSDERRLRAAQLERLRSLVTLAQAATSARTQLTALPAQGQAQREREAEATRQEALAATALQAAEAASAEDEQSRRTWTAQRDQLPNSARTAADRAWDERDLPMAEARDNYEQAVLAYERATRGSELAATVTAQREVLTTYAGVVAALPTQVRDDAQLLLDAGTDPQQLTTMMLAAEQRERTTDEQLQAASTELALADGEVRAATPTDRPRHRVLEGAEPTTRQAALEAARQEDDVRDRALAEENAAELRRTQLLELVKDHQQLISDLTVLLTALPEAQDADAFDGDTALAREQTTLVATRLGGAQQRESKKREELQRRAQEIFAWAADPRFAPVTDHMTSRFRSPDLAASLAPEAAPLAEAMAQAAATLRAHLEELNEHQKTAVTAMRGMVRGALKTLARLQAKSAFPDTLPAWEGRRFLTVGPKRAPDLTDAVLDDRIGRVVEAMCAAGSEIPKGPDLLWAATHAVVGEGNWTAQVLKPTVDSSIERCTVTQMRKWSGGEKVTANLLLFALAVQVRADERGRDHVGFGVLPLDNPLGKASYVPFLELQRKVAQAYGIQLLFLTGVADLRAVGRFPNIIRMANRSSGTRRYVGVDSREVEPDAVGLISQARIHRPEPIPGL